MKTIFDAHRNGGFSLLEVVLAIAVFAFGMLALVELQTGLARSGSDANTRTVAANIAEELIEVARGFTQLDADPDNNRMDFDEIVGFNDTVQRAGYEYSVDVIVENHYWDATADGFTTEQPVGIVNPDFKTMDIVVMWRPLEGDEDFADHDTIDLGAGGGLRIVEAIPSTPGLLGALVASDKEATGTPPVDYNPGANPDIIALTLDGTNGKFKEATTATPDVIRDEVVETWFDVVTYSQLPSSQATFLRREEFVAITCECELETSPAEAEYGLEPTLWNGVTYTEGEQVAKNIGRAPSGVQQSGYCSVCCRDHHDGAADGLEDVYNRDNAGDGAGDHPHYGRDNQGNIIDTPVGDGQRYVEACRLVRKDGFMRVTQDASQGTLIGFPEGYLEFDEGADAYSSYVIEAISDYYGAVNDQSALMQPDPPDPSSSHEFPARTEETATSLPTAYLANQQQLRARAVYTDFLTSAAKDVISECFPLESRTPDCEAPYATTPLEIYPFFDLQMTWLARWNNESASLVSPISVSNEALETGNTHDRGIVRLVNDNSGQSEVSITSQKGNLGLTATGPIDPDYEATDTVDLMYVNANNDDQPVPIIGTVVSGNLSSAVRRVPAADLTLTSETALCGQTDTEWSCVVPSGGSLLTIGNYYLNNPTVNVCSDLTWYSETTGSSPETVTTTFVLPTSGNYDIWVTSQACTP